MRIPLGIGALCGLLWLASGCAPRQQQRAVTATPSPEELPRFTKLERIIPANVQIEHRGIDPRLKLVPELKEPELTAEEKAALGETEPLFKFLLYGEPSRPAGSRVAPWYGGVAAYVYGYGGAEVLHGHSSSVAGAGGRGGITVTTDTFGSSVTRTGGQAHRPGSVGPRSGVTIGTGGESTIADHERRVPP
jgi:hypothetical protein